MPDFSDHPRQEQGASDMLPPFFAPRPRGRRATPPGAAVGGRGRLAPLFTPPGAGNRAGASESGEVSGSASPEDLEPVSVPFDPAVVGENVGQSHAPPLFAESAESASSLAPAAADLDGDAEGSDEVEDLVLETRSERAEHLVARESGGWPVVLDDAPDAVLSLGGTEAEGRVDRLELERAEWLPEATGEPLGEVESFWAAEPLQPTSSDDGAHLEPALEAARAQETVQEVGGLAEPDIAAFELASADESRIEQQTSHAAHVPNDSVAGDEFSAALAWPSERASQLADLPHDAHATPAEQALADTAPELRESAAPWADARDGVEGGEESAAWASAPLPSAAPTEDGMPAWLYGPTSAAEEPPAGTEAGPSRSATSESSEPSVESFTSADATGAALENTVAAALDRVARRIREGELPLPTDAQSASDEGALAMVLAALLRGGPRG